MTWCSNTFISGCFDLSQSLIVGIWAAWYLSPASEFFDSVIPKHGCNLAVLFYLSLPLGYSNYEYGGVAATLCTFVWELLQTSIGVQAVFTVFRVFLRPSMRISGWYIEIGHNAAFKVLFTVLQSHRTPILFSWNSVVKWPQNQSFSQV